MQIPVPVSINRGKVGIETNKPCYLIVQKSRQSQFTEGEKYNMWLKWVNAFAHFADFIRESHVKSAKSEDMLGILESVNQGKIWSIV